MNYINDLKTPPSVFIIVLNWNNWKLTNDCVDSLHEIVYPNFRIVLIDNGSDDESLNKLRCNENIIFIESKTNLGYAGGNNIGIRYAMENNASYLLIINNDTKVINPFFVQRLIATMESHPEVGILGPKVLHIDLEVQKTILFSPTFKNIVKNWFKRKFEKVDYDTYQNVEAVSGVCFLIRREVVEDICLIDEDYFMYLEEMDYCYKAKKKGWEVAYSPVDSIVHYKHPIEKGERAVRQYLFVRRNMILFQIKNGNFYSSLILAIFFILSCLLKVFYNLISKNGFYKMFLLRSLFRELKLVFKTYAFKN